MKRNQMAKRIAVVALAMVIALGGMVLTQRAAASSPTNTCGDNATWAYENGTLTISGTGAMKDYAANTSPWNDIRDDIKSIVVGSGITHIGDFAFYSCESLSSIAIPAGITSIGEGTFDSCKSLTSVTLDQNSQLTEIKRYAFSGSNIASFAIPATLTELNDLAFNLCSNLSAFTVAEGNCKFSAVDGVLFNKTGNELIAYPNKKGTAYQIPENVTTIHANAFYSTDVVSVSIPATLTTIGDCAFTKSCLKSITIPANVSTIGQGAFESCEALTTITIPYSYNQSIFTKTGIKVNSDQKTYRVDSFFSSSSIDGRFSFTYPVFTATGTDCGILTGVDNSMHYSTDGGETWTAISKDPVAIASGVTAAKGIITKSTFSTEKPTIAVSQAARPTTAAAVDCSTAANNDGKLTSVTADMEYRRADTTGWEDGTGSDIGGLTPGIYYVRVKAKGTTLASENQELTIKKHISHTVTFRVQNGSWDDGTTEDKTETVGGPEGDTLKLSKKQIPSAGDKPADGYKAGAWDVTPSTDTAITKDEVYTYTFIKKESATITTAPAAKTGLVANGSAQELITAGVANGGEMQYALGADATTAPIEGWTTAIPTGTAAGTYYAWYKVVGDNNHNDTVPACVTVTIAEAAGGNDPLYHYDINTADVAPIPDQTYTGQEIKPTVTVTFMGDPLTEGTDYTVLYANNIDVGEATVFIEGKGDFFNAREVHFKIISSNPAPIDIGKAKISAEDQEYTGKEIKPKLTVKLNGKKLKEKKDYTAAFKFNKDIGKATVTITGTGDYTGTATGSFLIIPKKVASPKLTAEKGKKDALTLTWKAGKGIDGYEIEYGLKKDFKGAKKIKLKGAKNDEYEIKKLTAKKTYYVRIRAWKKAKGKMYYSAWSKTMSKKVK